jgi:hypothetical protein
MALHRARFAAWTCARAISRGAEGVTVERVFRTMQVAKVDGTLANKVFTSRKEFDALHPVVVKRIAKAALKHGMKLSFGQAAKLLGIHIKTLYIMEGKRKDLLAYAHPPIDRNLLKKALPRGCRSNQSLLAWTQFGINEYRMSFELLENGITIEMPRWKIEAYWLSDLVLE